MHRSAMTSNDLFGSFAPQAANISSTANWLITRSAPVTSCTHAAGLCRDLLCCSILLRSSSLQDFVEIFFAAGFCGDLLQCTWCASVLRGGGWRPVQGGDGAVHQPHHAGAAAAPHQQPPHSGLSVTCGTCAVAAALH